MDILHNGWFTEFSPDDLEKMKSEESGEVKQMKSGGVVMGGAWPGQAFSLKVKEVLFHQRSDYQDILVFKSETYGNVLVLDGIIQATERDEFAYQEMLAHLPMFAHPNPKKVLIIGGGDGGILREVLKHREVEQVTMCEIDRVVIDVSKKFLPGMSCCFSNPKLNLHCGDGFEFLKNNKSAGVEASVILYYDVEISDGEIIFEASKHIEAIINQFDVIITDSSDPIGPAESLFGQSYYELLRDALNGNGVLSSQGECPWLDLALIRNVYHEYCTPLFPVVHFAVGSVPTYTSGLIGYIICSKSKDIDVTVPSRILTNDEVQEMNLRYYTSQLHSASFVLPQFIKKELDTK